LLRSFILGRVVAGPEVRRLEARIAAFFSTPGAIAYNSGRAALELALRATGVGAGDEVVAPTFCCTSIVSPILAVGALPVLADVGDALTLRPDAVEAACTPRTRAVVVAHLFGNPAPIHAIGEVCRRRGLILIDDAAQALGARLGDRLLGTFGDAGIVSFGNGKVCFGTGGGALISRDGAVLARARAVSRPPADIGPTVGRAASTLVWRRWRRWSLPLYISLARMVGERRDVPYTPRAMANLDAAVASTLLDTLETNLVARRARIDAYRTLLGAEPKLTLLSHDEGSACLSQVVDFHGDERLALRVQRVLRAAGYEVDRSYKPLHLQPEYHAYTRAPLPNAERVWSALVELPCEPGVRVDDVQRIAALVRATVGAC
jgi:dTDP-4-amino-4,6-dideoxygalactose transaminase